MKKIEWKHRRDRQQLTDAYRMYRNGILKFDHKRKIVEIYEAEGKVPALIFGSLGETLCELAMGKEECSFAEMWSKVKALEAQT